MTQKAFNSFYSPHRIMRIIFLTVTLALFGSCVFAQSVQEIIKDPSCSDAKFIDRASKDTLQLYLMSEITKDDVVCVKEILRMGINPNYYSNSKKLNSPIIIASSIGNIEIVQALIKAGADIKGKDGGVSLMFAGVKGYFDIAKLLLETGADVNAQGETDKSVALMGASFRERENIVDLLLKSGANVNAVSDEGISSLMLAADNANIVKQLIKAGAKIDAVDNKGQSALFYAVKNAQQKKLEILLENGAATNLTDKQGLTALSLAKEIKDETEREIVTALLKKYGAE